VGHWLKRVEARKDGTVQDSGFAILDTPFVVEYAEEISGRADFPDDATLDWTEPVDYDAKLTADDCFEPEPVLESLKWIQGIASKQTKENRLYWERQEKSTVRPEGPLPFSPDALVQRCAHDLGAMIRLCEEARAAGHLVVHVFVP